MIVPVENDHAIIAEIKSIQLSRSKFGISVPGSSDGILDHGKANGSCVWNMAKSFGAVWLLLNV